jgi:formylglycine-generating enzyme required for sulfatase activity
VPPDERERLRPHGGGPYGTIDVAALADGRWQLVLQHVGNAPAEAYRAAEGERIHYRDRTDHVDQDWLDFPVTGISWTDARAYAAWLAASGRVPGARLCDEREWERAARGADDRVYPHGDVLLPGDANFDLTYGQKAFAFGPDAVGLHPESDSPFGVADLAGNAWEWMRSPVDPDRAVYRGGSFYQDALSARSNNSKTVDRQTRSAVIGLRLCADAPAL